MSKTVIEPRSIFFYEGKLVEVIGFNEGHKSILMRYIRKEDMPTCKHCGAPQDISFDVIESSRNFQNGAEPVPTLEKT